MEDLVPVSLLLLDLHHGVHQETLAILHRDDLFTVGRFEERDWLEQRLRHKFGFFFDRFWLHLHRFVDHHGTDFPTIRHFLEKIFPKPFRDGARLPRTAEQVADGTTGFILEYIFN